MIGKQNTSSHNNVRNLKDLSHFDKISGQFTRIPKPEIRQIGGKLPLLFTTIWGDPTGRLAIHPGRLTAGTYKSPM